MTKKGLNYIGFVNLVNYFFGMTIHNKQVGNAECWPKLKGLKLIIVIWKNQKFTAFKLKAYLSISIENDLSLL